MSAFCYKFSKTVEFFFFFLRHLQILTEGILFCVGAAGGPGLRRAGGRRQSPDAGPPAPAPSRPQRRPSAPRVPGPPRAPAVERGLAEGPGRGRVDHAQQPVEPLLQGLGRREEQERAARRCGCRRRPFARGPTPAGVGGRVGLPRSGRAVAASPAAAAQVGQDRLPAAAVVDVLLLLRLRYPGRALRQASRGPGEVAAAYGGCGCGRRAARAGGGGRARCGGSARAARNLCAPARRGGVSDRRTGRRGRVRSNRAQRRPKPPGPKPTILRPD